jgi:hypothetical protein
MRADRPPVYPGPEEHHGHTDHSLTDLQHPDLRGEDSLKVWISTESIMHAWLMPCKIDIRSGDVLRFGFNFQGPIAGLSCRGG